MKSCTDYPNRHNPAKGKDYYQSLEDSPTPPNPSVGTIKADQTRISFDLDVTIQSKNVRLLEALNRE